MWKRIATVVSPAAVLALLLVALCLWRGSPFSRPDGEPVEDVQVSPELAAHGVGVEWCVTLPESDKADESLELLLTSSRDFDGVVSIYAPWYYKARRTEARNPNPEGEPLLSTLRLTVRAGGYYRYSATAVKLKERRIRIEMGEPATRRPDTALDR
jgi:hypothetical protein